MIKAASGKGTGKKGGKKEALAEEEASYPPTECIGAGRLEGWFSTPFAVVHSRGWGKIESFCFGGELFFHLHRSPSLRNVNYERNEPVTFEVIEINGRCEAVKLSIPGMEQGIERSDEDAGKPDVKDLVGTRVVGTMKSTHQVVNKQHFGFVGSESFAGQVFFHESENSEMLDIEYGRDDHVEFDLGMDPAKGTVRAQNMILLMRMDIIEIPETAKMRKKREWRETNLGPDWKEVKGAGKDKGAGRQDALGSVPVSIGYNVPAMQLGSADVSIESKIELCLAAFTDLTGSDAPVAEVIAKVQAFVAEVNDVLGQDRGAKHAFSMRLAKELWFSANEQEVRYKPGKNFLSVGGINEDVNQDAKRTRMEEGKGKGKRGKQALPQPMTGKGKGGLPQPADEWWPGAMGVDDWGIPAW